jgi:hypothetical protein
MGRRNVSALTQAGSELSALIRARDAIYEVAKQASRAGDCVTELEEIWDHHTDRIHRRVHELCWLLADLRAETIGELEFKVLAVQDAVDPDGDDLASNLTLSLCKDVLTLLRSKSNHQPPTG